MLDLETALRSAYERHLSKKDGATPANLETAMRYSLLSPGKRIRPRLALACARMLGLSPEAALPAALAIEMIHCFTLIHDDLPCMDDDDFRRGRPSNHKVHGESLALLAGDALVALALEVFLDAAEHVPADRVLAALRRFAWATGPRGVIGGQAAESLLGKTSSLEELRRMHAQKTGALFSISLLAPMELVGIPADSPRAAAIDLFARELGLAFQIADDLEDATEATAKDDPTSILFYLGDEEARRDTIGRLENAKAALTEHWKEAAQPLTTIADEVIRKIRDAHGAS
ncbi:MAG: polyprenyl synthetase family protein [Oligoflexia bacterium]|nr:polyprenyl synthetase family protein [Oligoflexia bacterium]